MTHDEEIIQEATEIYDKNQNAGALVGDLLRIIKSQKATIERQCEAIQQGYVLASEQKAEIERLQTNLEEAHIDIREHMAEIEKKDTEIDILIRKKHALRDEISELSAEIERLQKAPDVVRVRYEVSMDERDFIIQNAKTEAYREFAKLVNRHLNSNTPRGAYLYNIMKDVEKELIGESK